MDLEVQVRSYHTQRTRSDLRFNWKKGSSTSSVPLWNCQFYTRKTEVRMLLSRMMTTSWSRVSFVGIRGPKEGQIAPRPKITGVFLSTQDGSGGPSEVVPHAKDSIRPPFPPEKRITPSSVPLWTCQFYMRKTEVRLF